MFSVSDLINPIGSLLGGIVNGFTGFFSNRNTNKTNLTIARETNEANKNLAQYAYDMNLQQWNRENEYNSPAQQMARLQKAGLNPNLIYGNGQAVRASAESPQYRPPEMKAAHMQPWSGSDFGITTAAQNYYAGAQARALLANQIKQNSYLSTQEDYLKQQTVEKTLEIANKLIRNEHDQFNLDLAKELKTTTIAQAFANLEKSQKENKNLEVEFLEREQNVKLLAEKTNLTIEEARRVSADIDRIAADILVKHSVVGLNNAQRDYYKELKQLPSFQRLKIEKEIKVLEQDAEFKDFQNDLNAHTYNEQEEMIRQRLTNLIHQNAHDEHLEDKIIAEITALGFGLSDDIIKDIEYIDLKMKQAKRKRMFRVSRQFK